ncbi:hypothetical protein Trco_008247 [Trichoderma cornu-damae]|uniref:BTB domain-containing protein n=1 Tax=Trichoderma cornu-damae TaxID=654480 RepID=A0A9P8TSZ2_9HYPO|nr:hypothetical protein Trco_008247 [Trichoderma cornu-damae]
MNRIPTEVIATSIPFRFLVGPNQKEFTIHSALFTYQSSVLEKLVNGNFFEAAEKCVTWKEVDEDTFIRFWQFTYTGKYAAAPPVVEAKPESEATQESQSPATVPFLFGNRPKDEVPKQLTKREAQWEAFKNKRPSAAFGAFSSGIFGRPRSNLAHEDYTDTLISHARVYIFAECYGIADLMDLSLNELHGTLVKFTLHEERINDIVALVCYCYENLAPQPLRELISLYAACKVDKLWPSERFQELAEAHSELSKALLGLIVNIL